nr:retrovirus-related Pol polyprotein from transposon TNT 1-94 [Tanacetum cinerariifolium]
MFDEYLKPPPNVDHPVPEFHTLVHAASTSSPSSTTIDQDAPSTSTSQTTSEQQSSVILQGVEDDFYLGPERPRVYTDLSPEQKERYNADIQATNILLQGLPKDIYTLISHYTDAKDIWDNVKMLLEGSELTKKDQESQLYDDFEHFRQNKGETSHDYYVRFAKLINDMRNIKMTMSIMQPNLKVGNANPGQARQIKCYNFNGRQDTVVDEDVDEQPVQDLALNVDNIFQADDYDAFDYDVDEAPTAQTMFMLNLSSANPVYDEANPPYLVALGDLQRIDNKQSCHPIL